MAGLNSTVRIFSYSIPVWAVLLVVTEFSLCVLALYTGVYVRFGGDPVIIDQSIQGPLYPRALVFASMVVIGLLAMGLYHLGMALTVVRSPGLAFTP